MTEATKRRSNEATKGTPAAIGCLPLWSKRPPSVAPSLRRFVALALASAATACSNNPTTQPADANARQDSLIRDPFGYKVDDKQYDVSGGDLRNLDRNALKKDLDHVFNP